MSDFARGGRGPNEVENILSLTEKDNVIYLSDNGYLKRFNAESDKELRRSDFHGIWSYQITVTDNTIELLSPFNKVFHFPVYILNRSDETMELAIPDTREGPFNFLVSQSVSYTSTHKYLFYARKAFNELHIIDRISRSLISSYRFEGTFIRENTEYLSDKPDKKQMDKVFKTLFLIDEIHVWNQYLYVKFYDWTDEGRYFIGKIDIADKNGLLSESIAIVEIIENFTFFENHLLIQTMSEDFSQVYLKEVLLTDLPY